MLNTVMSKRYLRELVEKNIVDGWDDPRMPTLCGLRRRGYTPFSIFEFVKKAGVSKVYSLVDYRLLEYCIRTELETTALRRMAVTEPIELTITNYPEGKVEVFPIFPTTPTKPRTTLPPARWPSPAACTSRRATSPRYPRRSSSA